MKRLNKKSKIILLFSSLILVAGIAVVSMYATGVFPQQTGGKWITKGELSCHNLNCSCHHENTSSWGGGGYTMRSL